MAQYQLFGGILGFMCISVAMIIYMELLEYKSNTVLNNDHNNITALDNQSIKMRFVENDFTLDHFVMKINHKYPFRQGWSFDDYKSYNNSLSFKPILKLNKPQSLIKAFKHKKHTLPFTNPSIIDITSINNYQNFMLLSTNSYQLKNIINNTAYILIGNWNGNQCKQSADESYFYFDNVENIDRNYKLTGSGVILLDKKFNILRYVSLKLDKKISRLSDCRLFEYEISIYTICSCSVQTYRVRRRWIRTPNTCISKFVWREQKIHHQTEIIAYLSQTKQLYYKPNNAETFGSVAKNLIPLQYNKRLYFQWEIPHSYFIEINLLNNTQTYAYHNSQTFLFAHHNSRNLSYSTLLKSYHQNCGFVHLRESNELLAVGHIHHNLYNTQEPFGIKYGHHYTHFFYTINNEPPFHVKRMSVEFCFNSPFIKRNSTNSTDCDVIQFVTGMIETVINNKEYLFVTYGINDCIGSIIQIEKQFVVDSLMCVEYT